MTESWQAAFFTPIFVIALTAACSAGMVVDPLPTLNVPGGNELRITQTDPGPNAWALWDNLGGDDLHELPAAPVIVQRHSRSPVAPLPPAVFTGGSMLLAGAVLRLRRKLRLC